MVQSLEKEIFRDLIKEDSEGRVVSVDWEGMARERDKSAGGGQPGRRFDRVFGNTLRYLKGKGILADEGTSNTFSAKGCGIDLSPQDDGSFGTNYYFIREEDARAFFGSFYRGALYSVTIFKVI